ncbi:TIGR03885 family FMN-dependent LLM class oxidoreductase [uncultured Kocuria sp.]|uniref:TIGR03885 family FMN-dependent LLM class oxidoreductase n=1 Tax=uncultured Kocuria sp. TaxID=259305 RepID=UPI0026348FFF|nr:TIGR03885 family FMN-dependent LLM class oxidoreductase [uncultured Kocuria sp.]
MATIGFHASHEQIPPEQLLRDVAHAQQAGFGAAMCSDHLEPWSPHQGHSGFALSWLGAALATTDLTFGFVHAPGRRYHPVVTAQATATLARMFPGRLWTALGSGQKLNERAVAPDWPAKEQRQRFLEGSFDVVRRLHAGEEVSRREPFHADRARVWDAPEVPPDLLVAALTPATVRRFAPVADGFITVQQPLEDLRRMLDAWREAGGTGRAALQVHLSWATTPEQARAIALDQWRTNVFDPVTMAELASPQDYLRKAVQEDIGDEQVAGAVNVSADLGRHAEWLHEYAELGFDEIYLHHVGQEQGRFLDAFGESVLPRFAQA